MRTRILLSNSRLFTSFFPIGSSSRCFRSTEFRATIVSLLATSLFNILLLPHSTFAATVSATSCDLAAVSTAINAAQNGDTVLIPNGSCSWSSGISVTKQIKLQGQIPGGVTITHMAGAATLISFTTGSAFRTEIANLKFLPGTGTGVYLQLNGTGLPPLLHDCSFNIPHFQLQHAVRWFVTGGVIWNTTFESTDSGGSESGCLVVKSDLPWLAPSTLGTLDQNGDKNLYIEDTIFRNVGQCPDVDENGRVVVRRSQFIGSSGTTHGPTSTYGGRSVELYDNVMSYPDTNRNLNRYYWVRAGTAVITGNSIQAISGQMWGQKASFTFTVENARRSTANGCCTTYMCYHQPGSGGNGSSQISDPIYIWGNTGTGAVASRYSLNEGEPNTCPGTLSTQDFFQLNRDWFVDVGAKPEWSRYQYPHPLRGGVNHPPSAPTNFRLLN